jgi:hypothetical protein
MSDFNAAGCIQTELSHLSYINMLTLKTTIQLSKNVCEGETNMNLTESGVKGKFVELLIVIINRHT